MLFRHEDAGDIEVRRAGWVEFAAWGDAFSREQMADANQNLWATLAIKPPAAELPELIEDFSALPLMLAHGVIEACGSPGGMVGLSQSYPVVPDAEVPEETLKAARKRSRRAFFVKTPAGLWAMRPPGASASAAYQETVAAFGQGKPGVSFCGAMRTLTFACVLSPDPETAKAAIEEYPAIPWILRGELEARSGGGKALVRVS